MSDKDETMSREQELINVAIDAMDDAPEYNNNNGRIDYEHDIPFRSIFAGVAAMLAHDSPNARIAREHTRRLERERQRRMKKEWPESV